MLKLTIPSCVVWSQLLRCSESFSKIPAVWSVRNRPAFLMIHLAILYEIENMLIQLIGGIHILFIRGHMHVDGPVGEPSHPCKLNTWGFFVRGLDHDVYLVIAFWLCLHPLDPIVGRRMRGEKPPAHAPSACISHVSVAAMIHVPSRPMTWAAPAGCASDGLPAQGPGKAQGQRGAMRWRVGSEAWSCFSPWLRLSPSP